MITVVGTIKICDWRNEYFSRSLISVKPIAHLLSWQLNIAGEKREEARDLVLAQWDNASITVDDNETCTYDLMSAQLAQLPDDALVYPWVEDMWFVCPHVNLFLYVLDKFIHSKAEIMPVSHLVTVWDEQCLRATIMADMFCSEYLIEPPSQEQIWKDFPNSYWIISVSSIFKAGLLRDVLEHQKERLSKSCKPRGLELSPETARDFLADRSFIRLVPHFHVFREVVGFHDHSPRCIIWQEAYDMVDLRDYGGIFGASPQTEPAGDA